MDLNILVSIISIGRTIFKKCFVKNYVLKYIGTVLTKEEIVYAAKVVAKITNYLWGESAGRKLKRGWIPNLFLEGVLNFYEILSHLKHSNLIYKVYKTISVLYLFTIITVFLKDLNGFSFFKNGF